MDQNAIVIVPHMNSGMHYNGSAIKISEKFCL